MGKKKLLTLSPVILALLLVAPFAIGQNFQEGQLYSDYKLYFDQPREEIYLDLPKGVFYPGEPIQFAGYVFDKLNNLPAVSTTNVYCAIYDEMGDLIVQKLFYAQEGKFEGFLDIPEDKGSGKFYIKAFTNWMKNFDSDAMFLRDIYVVDENYETLEESGSIRPAHIEINPESNFLVAGVRNSVGFVFIPDEKTGIQVRTCQLTDLNDNMLIQEIDISPQGYGRFLLTPNIGAQYQLKIVTQNGSIVRQNLPKPKNEGFAISVNPLHSDHIAVEVRRRSDSESANDKLTVDLALHRDGRIKLMQFDLDTGVSNIFIPKKEVFRGLNKMSIFDADQNLLAERIFFNDLDMEQVASQAEITTKSNRPDSVEIGLKLKGISKKAKARLSLSVLPEETLANQADYSIRSWFMLQSYFSKGLGSEIRTTGMNRLSMHHLDLFLLNNSWNRYSWEDVLQKKPEINRSFENGISISGNIKGDKNVQNKRLIMYQKSVGEFFYSRIGPDLSFTYDNVYVIENEPLLFFIENHQLKKSTRMEVSLNPSDERENLMPDDLVAVASGKGPNIQTDFERPILQFPADEELDEVLIVAKKPEELTRNDRLAGVFEGDKIDEVDLKRNTYLSEYIRKLGFKVRPGPIAGEVIVSGKYPMSNPPVVYINGFRIDCVNGCQINDLLLDSVDEVYYEHVGTEGSDGGTLYIYEYFGSRNNKNKILQHIAEVGFSTDQINQRFKYSQFAKNSFLAYGNVHWESNIEVIDGEAALVKFPSFGLSHFKIVINGFSDQGDLISTVNYLSLD